eukprot:28128-Rhodomonas_salina.1
MAGSPSLPSTSAQRSPESLSVAFHCARIVWLPRTAQPVPVPRDSTPRFPPRPPPSAPAARTGVGEGGGRQEEEGEQQ